MIMTSPLIAVSGCGCNGQTSFVPNIAIGNPQMTYDATLGSPTVQNIIPPYSNLPASIYDINGNGDSFGWNTTLGAWK